MTRISHAERSKRSQTSGIRYRICRYCHKKQAITKFKKSRSYTTGEERRDWKCNNCRNLDRRRRNAEKAAGTYEPRKPPFKNITPAEGLRREIKRAKIPPEEYWPEGKRVMMRYWHEEQKTRLPALVIGAGERSGKSLLWVAIIDIRTRPMVAMFDPGYLDEW